LSSGYSLVRGIKRPEIFQVRSIAHTVRVRKIQPGYARKFLKAAVNGVQLSIAMRMTWPAWGYGREVGAGASVAVLR